MITVSMKQRLYLIKLLKRVMERMVTPEKKLEISKIIDKCFFFFNEPLPNKKRKQSLLSLKCSSVEKHSWRKANLSLEMSGRCKLSLEKKC